MIYKLGIIAVLIICGFATRAQTAEEKKLLTQFKYEKDIVYKIIDGDTLDMVLFLPKKQKYTQMPIMLYTHGGGRGVSGLLVQAVQMRLPVKLVFSLLLISQANQELEAHWEQSFKADLVLMVRV